MLTDHFVIIGWRGERTERLIDQLADVSSGDAPEIVLVSVRLSQNPLPDKVRFVKADNTTDTAAFMRAGIASANAVIVMAETDPDALAISLSAAAAAPNIRLVVYFEDERMTTLLKSHCPAAEMAPSLSTEILARTARDPGSAELFTMLASSCTGPTEFSIVIPTDTPQLRFATLMSAFKQSYDATLIAARKPGEVTPLLNPPADAMLEPGDQLYYIAQVRLDQDKMNWRALAT